MNCPSYRQRLASALLLSVFLAGCASSGPNPSSPNLQHQIETATTRADHQALAAHYEREAALARTSAAEHRKTARAYGTPPIGRGGLNTKEHCEAIASQYEAIATEYDGLAAHHHLLAQRTRP